MATEALQQLNSVDVAALHKVLLHYWNTTDFRPQQLEAVQATLKGHDVLLILPTGGGKSLCFQLPPLTQPNALTVVISPLISLAKDQVDAALERGIECECFNSAVPEAKRARIAAELASGTQTMSLLYTTPESIAMPALRDALKEAHSGGCTLRFAIDEAHCVSSWGHDFRPAYLALASIRDEFAGAPVMACTATATKQVQATIIESLRLKAPVILDASANRPNLPYDVRLRELLGDGSDAQVLEDLLAFLRERPGSTGIVYCHLRRTCDWLAAALRCADMDAAAYHAGRDAGQRASVQAQWSEGALEVVVATIAFGMGIDKADVRWVVHWDAPASLEAYLQESGRAGRDGMPSVCLMYASQAHFQQMQKVEKGERQGSVAAVAELALSACCRRKGLLQHFGERRGQCHAAAEQLCDFCRDPRSVAAALARLEDASQPQVDEAGAAEILEGTEGASRLGSRLGTVNRQAAMWRDARTLDQCSSAAGISAAVPRVPSPTVEAAAASAVTVTPQAPAGLPQQATMRPMRLGLSRKRILTEIAATGNTVQPMHACSPISQQPLQLSGGQRRKFRPPLRTLAVPRE